MQFETVDAAPDAGRACAACQRRIEGEYFEVAGRVVCGTCSAALVGSGAGMRPLVRALFYGGGAALLSTIVWYLIIKFANMELGLIAIGVGLFIGMAVRKGAAGRGGWKYQALAMLLTYGATTLSKAPLVVRAVVEAGDKKQAAGDESAATDAGTKHRSAPGPVHVGDLALALLFIVGLSLASPFLAGTENIMGIIIIGIALYEAWKLNKRVPVRGPFRLAPAGARPPVAPPPAAP